jgi:hypothetical protein
LQSCPHRPCALTHRVYESNFATLCGNAQGLRWQLSKKKSIFFFRPRLHRPGSALVCAGGTEREREREKKKF